jgi:hypothetical protein
MTRLIAFFCALQPGLPCPGPNRPYFFNLAGWNIGEADRCGSKARAKDLVNWDNCDADFPEQ